MSDQPPAGFGSGPPGSEPGDALRADGVPIGELVMDLAAPGHRLQLGLSRPEVRIDGYLVPVHWGQNRMRVPVGTRAVAICTRNPLNFIQPQFARAAMRVDVGPGQQIPAYYSLPFFAHLGGAIGLLIGLIAVVATIGSH